MWILGYFSSSNFKCLSFSGNMQYLNSPFLSFLGSVLNWSMMIESTKYKSLFLSFNINTLLIAPTKL